VIAAPDISPKPAAAPVALTAPPSSEAFRDRVATVDEKGKRVWVFPQKPKGKLYNRRTLLSLLYLVLLFGLPFAEVDGHPLFLFNVLERRFILFGQIFWPQDFFIFGVGMVVFVIFIALFTNVFGRVFCGWMCPQTMFMEMVFRKIEYFFEGDRGAQKMLAKAPWNGNKILRKGGKLTAFWLLSFVIANTFLAYIIGKDELFKIITEPVGQHWGGLAGMVAFTTVFFFVFGWMREQVCTVVCPYGRLQGVMLDKKSVVVAYDYNRGESRGKFKKNKPRTDLGDCIDCNQCVAVCPTGIDIRNGTQLECVNCTACIDACNRMMDAVGLPRDLIRYTSEHTLETGERFRFTRKMKAFTAVMVVLLGIEGALLATRSDVQVAILRTPGQLYQEQPGNRLSNLYNYKLLNKTFREKEVTLKPENFRGTIQVVGGKGLNLPAEADARGALFISMDRRDVTARKTDLKIGVYEAGKRIQTVNATFFGPFKFE